MITAVKRHISQALLLVQILILSGCSRETTPVSVQGGVSGVIAVERIASGGEESVGPRSAALIGIFVSDFLSSGPFSFVQTALKGIEAQEAFAADIGVEDEDYDLLQAFADALNVELTSMLNQSVNREEALNRYLEALDNVALRSQERQEELAEEIKSLKETKREQQREVSELKRELNTSIKEQDFSQAGAIQQSMDEKQAELAETDLTLTQLESIEKTFRNLLKIYNERAVAIESNREALITGVSVIDVPGAEDLEIIDKPKRGDIQKYTPGDGFQVPTFGG